MPTQLKKNNYKCKYMYINILSLTNFYWIEILQKKQSNFYQKNMFVPKFPT